MAYKHHLFSNGKAYIYSTKYKYKNVHSNSIYNSLQLETTQMNIHSRMDKENILI